MNKDLICNQTSIYVTLDASNHTEKKKQPHDYYTTDNVELFNNQ